MTYTLWSHGELIGESELDCVRVYTHLRAGDLQVTPKGLLVLDRVSQTHADAYGTARRLSREKSRGQVLASADNALFADLAAERDQYEALALELRAPNGTVVPTEDIYVRDTWYLLAIGFEADEEDELAVMNDTPEHVRDSDDATGMDVLLEELENDLLPWEQTAPAREPPRFQLFVKLVDEWAIP